LDIKVPSFRGLATGSVVAGRYRVTGLVGTGAMGAVYSAEHTATGQAVALKFMMVVDNDSLEFVTRFEQEARVMAGLKHPNTIRIYDFGRTDTGAMFMAMELLHGKSLEDIVIDNTRDGTAISEAETANYGAQILKSLAEAHGQSLVHRDLKPANVFLTDDGGGETLVKVLDFGIARVHNSALTSSGRIMGTPAYMSPEQWQGSDIDARADLYSVGCILYCCVTGEPPYEAGENMLALLHKHCTGPIPDPRTVSKQPLSDAFVAVVTKALAKSPDDRYSDARAMRAALESAVAGAPPQTARAAKAMNFVDDPTLRAPKTPGAATDHVPTAPSVRVNMPAPAPVSVANDTFARAVSAPMLQQQPVKAKAAVRIAPQVAAVVAEPPAAAPPAVLIPLHDSAFATVALDRSAVMAGLNNEATAALPVFAAARAPSAGHAAVAPARAVSAGHAAVAPARPAPAVQVAAAPARPASEVHATIAPQRPPSTVQVAAQATISQNSAVLWIGGAAVGAAALIATAWFATRPDNKPNVAPAADHVAAPVAHQAPAPVAPNEKAPEKPKELAKDKPIEAAVEKAAAVPAKPVEAKPVEAKPVEVKPVEAKPIDVMRGMVKAPPAKPVVPTPVSHGAPAAEPKRNVAPVWPKPHPQVPKAKPAPQLKAID